jgi:hypothetical protein
MVLKFLDAVLGRILVREIRDEAIGDLWELSYDLKDANKSKLLSTLIILKMAFFMVVASVRISLEKMLNRKSELKTESNSSNSISRINLCNQFTQKVMQPRRKKIQAIGKIWMNTHLVAGEDEFSVKAQNLCSSIVFSPDKYEPQECQELAQEFVHLHFQCQERAMRISIAEERIRQARSSFVMFFAVTIIGSGVGVLVAICRGQRTEQYALYGAGLISILGGFATIQSLRYAGRSAEKLKSVDFMPNSSNIRLTS